MEDRHTNADDGWMVKARRITGSSTWPRCSFYGVFDGHGGSRVASVASSTLWKNVQEALAVKLCGGGQMPPLDPEPSRVGRVGAAGGTAALRAAAGAAAAGFASGGREEGAPAAAAPSSSSSSAALPSASAADSTASAPAAAPVFTGTLPTTDELQELLHRAFDNTETEILNQAQRGRWEDGCTAVCVLLFDQLMVVGNLGDSRAVLCSDGKAVRLSEDHKPNSKAELARINAAGGFVKTIMGIARLNGDLSLSRAFGDQSFKKPAKPNRGASPPPRSPPPRGFQRTMDVGGEEATAASSALGASLRLPKYVRDGPLSSIPDVTVRPLDPADEFIILACDGVWDVFSDDVAVKHVQTGLKESRGNPQMAGEYLVDKVLRSARCTDNVSVIVVLMRWGG